MKGFINWLISLFKKFLGIQSPSQVAIAKFNGTYVPPQITSDIRELGRARAKRIRRKYRNLWNQFRMIH